MKTEVRWGKVGTGYCRISCFMDSLTKPLPASRHCELGKTVNLARHSSHTGRFNRKGFRDTAQGLRMWGGTAQGLRISEMLHASLHLFWPLYPLGNLWKPCIFHPCIYILHKISSRPSRNPWTSGVQDCLPMERPACPPPSMWDKHKCCSFQHPLTAASDLAGAVACSQHSRGPHKVGFLTRFKCQKWGVLEQPGGWDFCLRISLMQTCEEEEGEGKQERKKGIEGERSKRQQGGMKSPLPLAFLWC